MLKINSRHALLQHFGDLCDRIGPIQFLFKIGQNLPLNVGRELLERIEAGLSDSERGTRVMAAVAEETAQRELLVRSAKDHISCARECASARSLYRLPPAKHK